MKDTPGFSGVYARDQIPILTDFPSSLIFNTLHSSAPSDIQGHWIAVYFTRNRIEYYDVSGNPPIIMEYLRMCRQKVIVYNKRMIQAPESISCGLYSSISLNEESVASRLLPSFRRFLETYYSTISSSTDWIHVPHSFRTFLFRLLVDGMGCKQMAHQSWYYTDSEN